MIYKKNYKLLALNTDLHNAIKPTALMQHMQDTAENQLTDLDMDYVDLFYIKRKAFIISRMSIEIFDTVEKYAELEGRTWVSEGRAANFPRHYQLVHDGKVIAQATSIWAMVDIDTKKLVKFADYDTSNYPNEDPLEVSIPLKFRIPRNLELEKAGASIVGYTATDINMHMNNTMYADRLFDCVPDAEKYVLTSMNIHFMHEAPYGEEMEIYRSELLEPGDMDPRAEKIIYLRTQTNGDTNVEAVLGLKEFRK
jgi:medium-chain acyl-[acyl-carrier-protein] hydrolase